MFDPSLERFEVFRTSDVDEARDKTGRLLRPHRLAPLGRVRGGFDARHRVVSLKSLSFHYLSYGSDEVHVDPGALETFYVALIPRSGKSTVHAGHSTVTTDVGSAAVASPDDNLSMRWSGGCGQLLVKIPREVMENRLEALLHRPLREPLRFRLRMGLRGGQGEQWWDVVRQLTNRVGQSQSLLADDRMLAPVEQVVTTGLLLAQPHNYTEELNGNDGSASARIVRVATELVEDSLDLPVTVADLAAQAGVSARALQLGFRDRLHTTPMRYVHDVRLRRIHDALSNTDAESGATVTGVALLAGVTHLGRFAKSYFARYGEHPSDTLRRRQPDPVEDLR
jgi:AraC-like DNA-binding protein